MGSKAKYASYIVPILQDAIDKHEVNTYIECFVGGANIIDKIKCLIALLNQAATNFNGVLDHYSRELWDKGKAYVKDGVMPDDMSLADIGAIEFFGSYNSGGFPRGYIAPEKFFRDRDALKEQAPNLKGITFKAQQYYQLDPNTHGAVIYLDPPYTGTKQYGYKRQGSIINREVFWRWVRRISRTNYVFVSEQMAPSDFDVIWEKKVNRTMSKKNKFEAYERLFVYKLGWH